MNPILEFFKYEHLPEHLQVVSAPFQELAKVINDSHERNPEQSVALRKLLEAKDAAVRSAIFTNNQQRTTNNETK